MSWWKYAILGRVYASLRLYSTMLIISLVCAPPPCLYSSLSFLRRFYPPRSPYGSDVRLERGDSRVQKAGPVIPVSKLGRLVSTLLKARHLGISAMAGWSGVCILWLGVTESDLHLLSQSESISNRPRVPKTFCQLPGR